MSEIYIPDTTNIEIEVYDLVFETTRKCNGGFTSSDGHRSPCEHCLRGNPQKVIMSDDIIKAVNRYVTQVGAITFSGGEPTLVPHVIETILHEFNRAESFYIVTNGVRYSPKTVKLLKNFYYNPYRYRDKEMCALSVSVDDFHEYNREAHEKYKKLEFYRDDKIVDWDRSSLINEGLAKEHNLGSREVNPYVDISSYEHGAITRMVIHTLYINANGDVITDCNFSYERQNHEKLGNVLEESIAAMLLRAIHKKNPAVHINE